MPPSDPTARTSGVAGLATATVRGQWQFEQGKRDALLIMSCPRLRFLPAGVVLGELYKVPKLRDKWLVTSIHICPAFSMYLSNKCKSRPFVHHAWLTPRSHAAGEKVSLALVAQVPVPAAPGISAGAEGGIGWWSDSQADLLRKACDKSGKYCYTPLYTMKRRIGWTQRLFRQKGVEVSGDDLCVKRTWAFCFVGLMTCRWTDMPPPWQPLDEDGHEDALEVVSVPWFPVTAKR